MSNRQVVLNLPEPVYKELDKKSKHGVKRYILDLVMKVTTKQPKTSVSSIFDLFDGEKTRSEDLDDDIYG